MGPETRGRRAVLRRFGAPALTQSPPNTRESQRSSLGRVVANLWNAPALGDTARRDVHLPVAASRRWSAQISLFDQCRLVAAFQILHKRASSSRAATAVTGTAASADMTAGSGIERAVFAEAQVVAPGVDDVEGALAPGPFEHLA